MQLTRQQLDITKQIVRGAIKSYETMGWVRRHAFTDEKGRYVSVITADRDRVRAANIVGALMLGLDGADIKNETHSLDIAIRCVTLSLPKEYHTDPIGIHNWNDHECKSRSQAVRTLSNVLHKLESI